MALAVLRLELETGGRREGLPTSPCTEENESLGSSCSNTFALLCALPGALADRAAELPVTRSGRVASVELPVAKCITRGSDSGGDAFAFALRA